MDSAFAEFSLVQPPVVQRQSPWVPKSAYSSPVLAATMFWALAVLIFLQPPVVVQRQSPCVPKSANTSPLPVVAKVASWSALAVSNFRKPVLAVQRHNPAV